MSYDGLSKRLVAFIFLGCSLIMCTKKDQLATAEKEPGQIEKRFFTGNRTQNGDEKVLVDYLIRQHQKNKFVEKTVEQIGYPRWDKMIVLQRKGNKSGRGESDSSVTSYYIPFVRDSQQFVNASMIINTTASDTSFGYRCDWQYAQRQNSLNSVSDSAEYHAIFFMVLDKAVFGYTEFNITDTSIFKHNNLTPLRIKLTNPTPGNRGNDYTTVQICQNVIVTWQDCPYPRGQCKSDGTCDNCDECTNSGPFTYCWTTWIAGGSGSGSTGGPGAGSSVGTGGGGNTGGGAPPPCPGTSTSQRGQTVTPGCDPGWNPTTTPLAYLTNTLSLNSSQTAFLLQNPNYQAPLYNFISQNFSSQSIQICKEHINLLMTKPEYVNFVNNHDITGNHSLVWWMDSQWLDNPSNFNLDITRLDNQYKRLTAEEKALVIIYPIQAFLINLNVQTAFDMSNARMGMGTSNGLNDKKDAFRHAFYQAINTRDVPGRTLPIPLTGSAIVSLFATAHESEVPQQLHLEREMDLFNNGVGISYCWNCWITSNNSIADAIIEKINNGELKYLSPLNIFQSPKWPQGLNGILPSTTIKWTNQ
jgi:hypothetical protein